MEGQSSPPNTKFNEGVTMPIFADILLHAIERVSGHSLNIYLTNEWQAILVMLKCQVDGAQWLGHIQINRL